MRFALIAVAVVVLFAAAAVVGCGEAFRSDSANALRQNKRDRDARQRGNEAASRTAPPATAVRGEALVSLVSGKSHVAEYRKRSSDAKPYLTTYQYFRPDGVVVFSDTHSKRTPEYQTKGTWNVQEDRLCVTGESWDPGEFCYEVRVAADRSIQMWLRKPGDPLDGLLASNVTIVRSGPQVPEYQSDPAAFR